MGSIDRLKGGLRVNSDYRVKTLNFYFTNYIKKIYITHCYIAYNSYITWNFQKKGFFLLILYKFFIHICKDLFNKIRNRYQSAI